MKLSYKDFRPRIVLALLAIVVLIGAGVAVLEAIWAHYRQNISGHIISNLETMSRGAVLLQQDSVARVRKIADEPTHKAFVARLIANPDDPSIHDAFQAWITPLYQSRGFDDYSLITPDGKRVMTAGTRPYIGQLPLPSTRETLRRAELLWGGAVAPPISAKFPFSTLMVENPSAYAYQLSCAPVDQDGLRMAFLCLHENPSLRLYRLLRDGRPGVTGEAYVVDQEGRILSPIRFEKSLAAPEGAEPGWSLFQLRARVMPQREDNGLPDPLLISTEPLTRVVERLLEFNSFDTGLLEDYADYRGRRVVGAARWLPDAALGLVVEEDMEEAFRSYYFARHALTALIGLGALLIVALTYVDWRSRRSLESTQRDLKELAQTLEKKVAERTQQLEVARDMAESASRAKAEFLANMSHEVRTPLNAIIGMGHLAAQVNADGRVGHYLGRIQSSSQHLLGIVNDILDLSKVEAGKLRIDVAAFSLAGLLDHVAAQVLEQAEQKGLRLVVPTAASLPDRLVGDAKRIGQILINFTNNAVKFTERGSVTLRVLERGRENETVRLRFEVEDTGIGIPPDKLPLLFSPFQQLDGSMARQFEGSGLGLAISRNLAELMGGVVEVHSQPGQGSVFALELPLRVGEPAPGVALVPDTGGGNESVLAARMCLAGRAILLIEDNAINQEVVRDLLQMCGAEVTIAGDGMQGIRMLDNGAFDLVLMDIHMPNMDGFEATAEIRKSRRFARLPIVALTANALEGDLERCLAAGMNDYIAKPIQPHAMFATLAKHLLPTTSPVGGVQNPASRAGMDRVDLLLDELAGIPGIDVEQAVARMMGRRDLYATLARRVAGERREMVATLEQALRDCDRAAMRESIHAAKSLLGMLGAEALQQRCVALQCAFGDGTVAEADVAAFATDLAQLLQQLGDVVGRSS